MPQTPTYPGRLGDLTAWLPKRFTLRSVSQGFHSLVVERFTAPFDRGDGFPGYAESARKAGIDVNDWIERELGWIPARPTLDELVFPLIRPDAVVCEVGVGTGRWSRHILAHIPDGTLVLVDRSPWVVNFVREYFAGSPNVSATRCDGTRLPFERAAWADLIFSQGVFITLRLGHVLVYLREFARCLRQGGYAVFDFIDPGTPAGWEFLEREAPRAPDVFAYHRLDTITRCCDAAGLSVERMMPAGKSTYVVAAKR